MSIGNHLMEIARQLWASLTGGWYYEPANSLFCNTLHFYIWCVLLVLPLILGVISTNSATIGIGWLCIYAAFICILFSAIKTIVGYLNNVFDMVDPIITQKRKRLANSNSKSANFLRSPLSSISVRATDSNGIELMDLLAERSRNSEQNADNINVNNLMIRINSNPNLYKVNNSSNEKQVNSDGEELRDTTNNELMKNELIVSGTQVGNGLLFRSNFVMDASGSGAPLRSRSRLGSSTGVLPPLTDSLELLPLSSSNSRYNSILISSGLKRTTSSYYRRKYSDPNMGSLFIRRYQGFRRAVDERVMPIRRVHSTGNRMNIPRTPLRGTSNIRIDSTPQRSFRDRSAVFKGNAFRTNLKLADTEDIQQPCCSNSLVDTNLREENSRHLIKLPSLESENFFSQNNKSKIKRLMKASALGITNDLKGEITKLLEELIEKHPETLDAIENVRMNRLGRTPILNNASELTQMERGEIEQQSDKLPAMQIGSPNLYQVNFRDGTHVAYDHEDTSQGAIHSFQDEQGNWWTYAFDEEGSGTAQALGSSRAIHAMFNKRRKESRKRDDYNISGMPATSDNSMPVDGEESKKCMRSTVEIMSEKNVNVHALQKNKELNEDEVEIIPKIEIIEVLSRSGRHLTIDNQSPQQSSKTTKRSKSNERESRAKDNELNSSSSSESLNSATSYSSPTSSSSSDDGELTKYMADRPIAVFCPRANASTADAQNDKAEVAQGTSGAARRTCHIRYPSDSVSFLGRGVRNSLTNACSSTTRPDRSFSTISASKTNEPILNKTLPSDTIEINRFEETNENNDYSDSNVMERYYKHLRRHRRCHRYQDQQPAAPNPEESLQALELLQMAPRSFNADPITEANSSANVNRNIVLPATNRLFDESIASGLRSLARRTLNAARYNPETVTNSVERRNFIFDSDDSVINGRIPNDSILRSHDSNAIQRDIRFLSSMRFFNDLQSIGRNTNFLRMSGHSQTAMPNGRTKMTYHYKIKLIPKPFYKGNGFKIRIDRLSLSALFDRNYSLSSATIDVILATIVALFAAALNFWNVYSGFGLVIFAFVVAGSQFSLLKSVQPDAASPVHGFNYLISYSRPVYFCVLSFLFFFVDFIARHLNSLPTQLLTLKLNGTSPFFQFILIKNNTNIVGKNTLISARYVNDIGWLWSAPWLHLYTNGFFFLSLKEIISASILFLPLAFTLGLLPQIDTLLMHVLEQLDMNLFGATASFSLLASIFSLGRNITAVVILSILGHFSREFESNSTQNIAFSAFVGLTISMAFLASRWSTNPLNYFLIGGYFRKLLTPYSRNIFKSQKHRQNRQKIMKNKEKCKCKRHGKHHNTSTSSLSTSSSSCRTSNSLTSNSSMAQNNFPNPFIKSFCCTAKFTSSKPDVVEISKTHSLSKDDSNVFGVKNEKFLESSENKATKMINDKCTSGINLNSTDGDSKAKADNAIGWSNSTSTAYVLAQKKKIRKHSSILSISSTPAEAEAGENACSTSRNNLCWDNDHRHNLVGYLSNMAFTNIPRDENSPPKMKSATNDDDELAELKSPIKLVDRSLQELKPSIKLADQFLSELKPSIKSADQFYHHLADIADNNTLLSEEKKNLTNKNALNSKHGKYSKTFKTKRNSSKADSSSLSRKKNVTSSMIDALPAIIERCVIERFHHDIFYFFLNTFLVFGIHSTSIFTIAQPYFEIIISILCILMGFTNHNLYPHLLKHTPWKLLARPVLRPLEFAQHESITEARLMTAEKVHVWLLIIEKSMLYPLLVASMMSTNAWRMPFAEIFLTTICGFRIARSAFSQPQRVYLPLAFTFFISYLGIFDSKITLSSFFLFYLLIAIWPKVDEFLLKLNFILVYIAPWQISWGSAFHAFAQPFSVPHTGLICAQAAISSIFSAPLNPFLGFIGSSFFLMSYVRPVKFWERDYNTKRIDHSNLRLISQLDRGPILDDSNLNAIFYEHLTRSLQKWLAGDLLMGRWATAVQQGDCFILASLYINCFVHIIEVGNGFVTFQVRGLEFRGTYCHQREVEAISEDSNNNGSCCCCNIGKLPGFLSFNNAWSLRWLAWEVITAKYIIDGYSITDNSAVNLLQVHELRRLLVTLYVKCIIYYSLAAPNFDDWLINETVLKALEPIQQNSRFVDSDQIFSAVTDEDYDVNLLGISKPCFIEAYGVWIEYCWKKRQTNTKTRELVESGLLDLSLVTCFSMSLSLLARRALGTASFNRHANSAESFLFGLHALFKGDMRITSTADEWVFTDPEILTTVISPAVRMSLKLHQDHFLTMDEFEDVKLLYARIQEHQSRVFISHEHDPAWRVAIIANTPSLLALRHIFDDGQDDYKIIMLNKMALNMRVIKLNRECVRAFWAGQQQELIFLRNRNPERGSIQNARQVLRNMINSSADQPIGYPIYVSPLMTSFVETHPQVNGQIFSSNSPTFFSIWRGIRQVFARLQNHFGSSNTSSNWQQSSSATTMANAGFVVQPPPPSAASTAQVRLRHTIASAASEPIRAARGAARASFYFRPTGSLPAEVRQQSSARDAFAFEDIIRHHQTLVSNAESVPRVVGPEVSPAGSTPAPYRKSISNNRQTQTNAHNKNNNNSRQQRNSAPSSINIVSTTT